ncbi:major facilitator superfamily domain-containing protein [Phthorimaea operculella]|nr:major facilitator superfamily domain-containing protein [Phthorimaea operculella]
MSSKGETAAENDKPTYGWGFRHINALMLSLAMMICYAMRVCMSIAIVSMTDSSKDEYFDWSGQIQSVILSSFFWGYVVLQIPSGEMAARIGGKILITICIGVNSATALLLPIGSYYKLKTPWKSIWTCIPFLALVIAHCGQNWGYWTLMTKMPSYMAKVLGVDIKANGVMSAIPYMAMFLVSFPLGYLSDLALRKNWMSLNALRKFSNSVGHYGPAIALLVLSYVPGGNVTAVALLTVALSLNAGHFTGFLLVHIDMSPNFAGQMMGITNFFANIMGIIAPLAAGVLLKDETDPSDWRKVFYLSSALYVVCNTIFVIFGTSERQTWNEVPESKDSADAEAQKKDEKLPNKC